MTPSEFLKARLDEDEAAARAALAPAAMHPYGDTCLPALREDEVPEAMRDYLGGPWGEHAARWDMTRVLADVAAKRRALDLHEQWVVLITTPPKVEQARDPLDFSDYRVRMTQQIDFATREEYRRRFGDEPPTAPFIVALIQPYAEHPDFDPAWRQG